MELNRRSFLRGILTVSAMTALPLSKMTMAAPTPFLVGDGKHDDWAALQAFFDLKPFRTADGFVGTVTEGEINGGRFFCNKRLIVPIHQTRLTMRNSQLVLANGEIIYVDKMTAQGGQTSTHGGPPYAS